MAADMAHTEKACHVVTYETTTCRTVYMCTRVRVRECLRVPTCVRMCVCDYGETTLLRTFANSLIAHTVYTFFHLNFCHVGLYFVLNVHR